MPNWCGGGRVRGSRDKPSETNSLQLDRVREAERERRSGEKGRAMNVQKKRFFLKASKTIRLKWQENLAEREKKIGSKLMGNLFHILSVEFFLCRIMERLYIPSFIHQDFVTTLLC